MELAIFGPNAQRTIGLPVDDLMSRYEDAETFMPHIIKELCGKILTVRISLSAISFADFDNPHVSYQVDNLLNVMGTDSGKAHQTQISSHIAFKFSSSLKMSQTTCTNSLLPCSPAEEPQNAETTGPKDDRHDSKGKKNCQGTLSNQNHKRLQKYVQETNYNPKTHATSQETADAENFLPSPEHEHPTSVCFL